MHFDEVFAEKVLTEEQDFREEGFIILQGLLKGKEQGEFNILPTPARRILIPIRMHLLPLKCLVTAGPATCVIPRPLKAG